MSDFPDPDEEYELMYADELELLRDINESDDSNAVKRKQLPAKRSLDFSSPVINKTQITQGSNDIVSFNNSQPISQSLQPLDDYLTPKNASNKRTADDLFGDINDIDFEDIELPSKRQKTEEENDLELINRILESRKLKQSLLEPSRVKNDFQPTYLSKENLSLNIPRWPFMPLTNSDGQRIYVKLESEESWDSSLGITDQTSLHSTFAKAWEEARRVLEEKQNQKPEEAEQPIQVLETDANNNLLLEKYRPQSYLDLLSEEPVNRALLHWLHLWDKIVFNKEVKTSEPQQRNSFSKRTGQFQLTNKWKGKKEVEPEIDEDGRPHHKVALLCGPPGVGKTTLAHLLAKISGYRPVELNASDERSVEAFRSALQAATLMRSVLDKDRRPNCLILDEIDGAPLPTVELLVKWCTATVAEGKKKAKTHPLRRPVIAICNDLYATSLRPLRSVALVIQVGGATSERVVRRLSRIAAGERVAAAPRTLAALAARAAGDLRAALHVLALVRARVGAAGRQLKMEDVENAAIGTKDCHKTLMQALQAVFTVNDQNPDEIMKTIQAAGEYDRLVDGIFENYLSSRVDGRLLVACETMSWLRLHDTVSSWTMRTQNYSLYSLLPLCVARCHAVLATRTPLRVKFPMQAQEMYRKRQELECILQSVYAGCAPSVALSRNSLQLDVLPLLPYLLSPKLRSANVQLCSESERRSLTNCAAAMCDYGLQLVPRRQPAGLFALELEPDVYKIAFFGNEERARPPPALRQAIAREQQLEMIRRNEEMMTKGSGKENTKEGKLKSDKEKSKEFMEARVPNHLQRLQPKILEKKSQQVHKDFFGRIVPISQVQRSDAVPDVISSSSVFYQYREGFNNAVRRSVRTRDML
ncbi:chromosome transmission fidelity protein 18 homolog [Galleria mellonella]|uniref:Chromosome transmission fidelity protein 18 homolog n=1 Tax=Galleria mellonella TaxID=7137 RepID=A0ABM3MIW1_GALME|nr:chromosome transmission fidelity protein 18 homolog [Galleria mellonella]